MAMAGAKVKVVALVISDLSRLGPLIYTTPATTTGWSTEPTATALHVGLGVNAGNFAVKKDCVRVDDASSITCMFWGKGTEMYVLLDHLIIRASAPGEPVAHAVAVGGSVVAGFHGVIALVTRDCHSAAVVSGEGIRYA